jgi:hypothetical protein
LVEGGEDGGRECRDAGGEGKVGGCFEGDAVAGAVLEEPEGFGPIGAGGGIGGGQDDAWGLGGTTVDDLGGVDGADLTDGLDDGLGEGRLVIWIEFVEVEAGGFPIFVEEEGKIEGRQGGEPPDMGGDFG